MTNTRIVTGVLQTRQGCCDKAKPLDGGVEQKIASNVGRTEQRDKEAPKPGKHNWAITHFQRRPAPRSRPAGANCASVGRSKKKRRAEKYPQPIEATLVWPPLRRPWYSCAATHRPSCPAAAYFDSGISPRRSCRRARANRTISSSSRQEPSSHSCRAAFYLPCPPQCLFVPFTRHIQLPLSCLWCHTCERYAVAAVGCWAAAGRAREAPISGAGPSDAAADASGS